MEIPKDVVRFLTKHGVTIVSTLDEAGHIHCAVKEVVGIDVEGKIFLIDLFRNRTYKHIQMNPSVSITAVNEEEFKGYTLQGQAKIVAREDIQEHIVKIWEEKIVKRISDRMIKSVQKGVKSKSHFEAELPHKPKYLIEIDVDQIIDLSPPCKKKE